MAETFITLSSDHEQVCFSLRCANLAYRVARIDLAEFYENKAAAVMVNAYIIHQEIKKKERCLNG